MIGGEIAVRSFYRDHDCVQSLETLPAATALGLSPRDYLAHLGKVKKAVRVPVIASLNGTSPGSWIKYASLMQNEGADALELNLYRFATEPWDPSEAAERRILELVRSLKAAVRIPLTVKLSPFYTSLPHFVRELDHAGANAVLLFSRFYQADIDLERMELVRTLELSHSSELLLRLRWLAALHGRISASLGVTGGVHMAEGALKAILTGAHVVLIVSALLEHGPEHLGTIRRDTETWLERHQAASLNDLRGRMSRLKAPIRKSMSE